VLKGKAMTGRIRSKTPERAERNFREGRLEGIIDAPKSGRWGKWVYGMLGKTQCCRTYVMPRNPDAAAQRQARGALGSAARAWRTKLTPEQRQAWEMVARQQLSKPRLAQSGLLEGEQVFVRHCTVLKKAGKEMLLWPSPRPLFPPNPVAGLSIIHGSNGVRITLRVSGPVTEDIMVSGQAPCSAGRKKWRHGAYLCLVPPAEGGEYDVTAKYVERFGEPAPGLKVFIRTQQQRDGWRDLEMDVSEVVPEKAKAVSGESARLGAKVALTELNGSTQPPKFQEVNELDGVGGVQVDGAVRGRGEGRGVRGTRGWFRVATAAIPSHYRWGTRERWHSANGKWQTEGVGGRHARRHWRELWHGS
jgi:hypothetical protein